MTKKIGHILEKIADDDNLELAIKRSQRGGKAKRSAQIRAVNADVKGTVQRLKYQILNLDFPEHKSRKMQLEALDLINALFCEVNPIPVKTAMNMMGMEVGPLRSPLCSMDPKNEERLRKALTDYGIQLK